MTEKTLTHEELCAIWEAAYIVEREKRMNMQTNEEWLRQCNTEQLAEVLNKIFMTRTFCHICPESGVCDIGYKCKYHGGNTKDFVEWLKQPHKE